MIYSRVQCSLDNIILVHLKTFVCAWYLQVFSFHVLSRIVKSSQFLSMQCKLTHLESLLTSLLASEAQIQLCNLATWVGPGP